MKTLKLVVPVLIVLIAIYLRLQDIAQPSLWHDEGNSLRLAERTISDLIEATSRDIHPPGYYLILKAWTSLIGTSELGLRTLSAFWGMIAVATTYSLGRRLYGIAAGGIAALLIAYNPFAIYYGQETRMYAQLAAVTALSLWMFYGMLRAADLYLLKYGEPKAYSLHFAPWAFGLSLINTLGLYTHYLYPFTMLTQGIMFVWWTLGRNEPRARVSYIALNLLTLMLFQPWISTAYDQLTTWPSTTDPTPLSDRLSRIAHLLFYGDTQSNLALWILLIPLFLIGVGGISLFTTFKKRPSEAWRWLLPVLWVALNISALLFFGAYRPANFKFLLLAQIGIALLIGFGAVRFLTIPIPSRFSRPTRPLIYAISATALVFTFIQLFSTTQYTESRSDYRRIAQVISTQLEPNDAIILTAPNQQEVFSYYYHGSAPVIGLPRGLGGDDPATEAETRAIIATHSRIFLVLWGQQERDPNNIVQRTLDQNACVYEREWYGDVELVQYAVTANTAAAIREDLNMRFGEHITLQGFALSSNQATLGDVLCITLFWQTDTRLETPYKVSVQLLYPSGFLAEQHDSEPSNGGAPTTTWPLNTPVVDNHGITLKPEFDSGTYTLQVILYDPNRYDPDNPEAGRLSPQTDPPTANNALFLTTIQITPH